MHEWRQRAQLSETKVSELEKEVSRLRVEMERAANSDKQQPVTPEIPQDIEDAWGAARIRDLDGLADSQKENEKRVLVCRLKDKPRRKEEEGDRRKRACSCGTAVPKRLPLQEVGNSSSPWRRQTSTASRSSHPPSHPPIAGRED